MAVIRAIEEFLHAIYAWLPQEHVGTKWRFWKVPTTSCTCLKVVFLINLDQYKTLQENVRDVTEEFDLARKEELVSLQEFGGKLILLEML